MESDEAAGYLPICADQEIQCQPWADHAVKAQREREHPHHRDILPDPELPGGGRDGVPPGRKIKVGMWLHNS